MSEQSQYDALLEASARELCRFKGVDPDAEKDEITGRTHLDLQKTNMKEYVDNFYEALALKNASQALHGPSKGEEPKTGVTLTDSAS